MSSNLPKIQEAPNTYSTFIKYPKSGYCSWHTMVIISIFDNIFPDCQMHNDTQHYYAWCYAECHDFVWLLLHQVVHPNVTTVVTILIFDSILPDCWMHNDNQHNYASCYAVCHIFYLGWLLMHQVLMWPQWSQIIDNIFPDCQMPSGNQYNYVWRYVECSIFGAILCVILPSVLAPFLVCHSGHNFNFWQYFTRLPNA